MNRALLCLVALLAGCTSVPGKTTEEKRAFIQEFEQETLEQLHQEHPEAKAALAEAPGYVVVRQKVTKVPLVGGGGGYGVVVDGRSDERTYMKLRRLDLGGGYGVRSTRIVLILHEPELVDEVKSGKWRFGAGAEAAAKAGEAGAAGGGGTGGNEAYTSYQLTDAGVSATVTINALRLSPYKSLN